VRPVMAEEEGGGGGGDDYDCPSHGWVAFRQGLVPAHLCSVPL